MSDSSTESASGDEGSSDDNASSNWLEWTAFGLGVLITLSVVGYLGYQIATGSDEPANLQVTLQAPEAKPGGAQSAEASGETVLIPLEVKNTGDRVAEMAVVEVCAGPDACAQVSFAFVPKGSKRTGTVGLSAPLAEPPTSRVVSYRTQ